MKSLSAAVVAVAVLALSVQAVPGAGRMDASKVAAAEACHKEFSTAAADLEGFASSGDTKSKDLKCFMRCVMEAHGMMTTDGELAPMQKAVPADLQRKIEPCFSLPASSDPCEVAFEHNKCLWEKTSPDRGFLKLFAPRS